MAPVHFPNESAAYREARQRLLEEEAKLRHQTEQVAALRRSLPLGGEAKEDYVFDSIHGGSKRLSELFEPGKDTLLLYSYMYGPNMKQPCVMCTSFLDGLNGQAEHLRQRMNLAVTAKSDPERIRAFTDARGWSNLPLYSDAGSTYHRDYLGETPDGGQMPMLNVFVKRDGKVYHSYGTELLYADSEPGQDARHIDPYWPLWNLLDLTPEGRGTSWHPKLKY